MAPYGAKARTWDVKNVVDFISTTGLKQYGGAFEGNNIDGKRFMKLNSTQLPQMGIQRFDHIKHLWRKIKHIQAVCIKYEEEMKDPEAQMNMHAANIQSLARGKISRRRVEEIKAERAQKEQELFMEVQKQNEALILEQEEGLTHDEAMEAAALKIQQRARGMKDRRKVAGMKERGELPGQGRGGGGGGGGSKRGSVSKAKAESEMTDEEKAALKIQQRARGMKDRKMVAGMKERGELPGQGRGKAKAKAKAESEMTDEEKAALKIQQRARGMKDRKMVAGMKERGELPGQTRKKHNPAMLPDEKEEEDLMTKEQAEAAQILQKRARGMQARKDITKRKEAGELPGQNRGRKDSVSKSEGEKAPATELSEEDRAAMKIQQRHRGGADRKKVAAMKEAGELPGQKRAAAAAEAGVAPDAAPAASAEGGGAGTEGGEAKDEAKPDEGGGTTEGGEAPAAPADAPAPAEDAADAPIEAAADAPAADAPIEDAPIEDAPAADAPAADAPIDAAADAPAADAPAADAPIDAAADTPAEGGGGEEAKPEEGGESQPEGGETAPAEATAAAAVEAEPAAAEGGDDAAAAPAEGEVPPAAE